MSFQRRKYDPDFKRNAVRRTEETRRTVIEVADNLGISKAFLYKWRREFCLKEGLVFPGHGHESLTEQEKRIKEREKKLKDAEIDGDIKKSNSHLQQRTEMKYKFIEKHRSSFQMKKMC